MKKRENNNVNNAESNKAYICSSLRGFIVLCISIAIFISLLSFAYNSNTQNWLGLIGYGIGKGLHALFGISSYLLCSYITWIGWRQLFHKPINHPLIKSCLMIALTGSICLFLSLIEDSSTTARYVLSTLFYPHQFKTHFHLGGALFYYLYKDLPLINMLRIFNATGVALICVTTISACLLILTKTTPAQVVRALISFLQYLFSAPPKTDVEHPSEESKETSADGTRFVKLKMPNIGSSEPHPTPTPTSQSQDLLAIQPETTMTERPSLSQKAQTDRRRPMPKLFSKELSKEIAMTNENEAVSPPPPPATLPATSQKKRQSALTAQRIHNGDFKSYVLPPPSLLTTTKKVDQSSLKQDLRRQAEVLEETLTSFGIEAKVGQINCGPSITSFEVHPAIGVKVQKIKTLENDIALNMEAKSIRIIAPIPGKAAVGIEVPNAKPQEVGFKEMLLAYQQTPTKMFVPVLLGKTVTGEYVMSDLAKMPHCIIAGATGSGKSVCINTIVIAILMNAKPDEIRLIMVDPKKVELTPYTKLPHMLAPVITEPQGACAALNWLVKEMENRYEILKQLGLRNIQSFNTRTINKELEDSLDRDIPEKMPYIVLIIDELADLMMVSSNDIETPIARIAQMARAVGIHMILATQRPSREVITGLIKANFPTRISFKVASRVNSQIILDEIGSESLLGNGDMLFLPPGTSTLVRAQGAFIRDADITAVIKHICDQAPPNYVIASFDDMGRLGEEKTIEQGSSGDSLYDQALDVVLSTGNASTTFLQRKLKVGYARAASLIDEMEGKGVIGAAEGSKPRKILTPRVDADGDAFLPQRSQREEE